ncbi:E3 ubiquitin-protein ligase MARCHF7 isoform X2 [Ambystoma mexicanum]|uniref:E3 ubiquitin-protein ligase MARCHF7 isoform X2 n=1 Tax=Ambystoma mexicanum TaxID=8296 RepID=UPI0037E971AA
MKSNSARNLRRRSVQPSSSSPLTGRPLYGSGRNGLSDAYPIEEDLAKLESEFQSSSSLDASRRDWTFGERERFDSAWKHTTLSGNSGNNMLGNRLLPTSETLQSAVNCESEQTLGAYSRLHNQQQDRDSKRPKLSYSGYPLVSGMRSSSSGLSEISDSSWRHSRVPRSSSSILGSSDSELMGRRRAHERTSQSTSAFVEYSSRNGNLTSSTYLHDRVANSHAQGARPKQSVLSPLQLNTSTNHQLPSEHQSSLFTGDSNRSSQRLLTSTEGSSSQRSAHSDLTRIINADEFPASSTEMFSPRQPRSVTEAPTDTEGRRTTRQILSRLASSMSSTLFSRRSSQESLRPRALDPEYSYGSTRVQNATPSNVPPHNVNATSNPNAADVQSSEPTQGFGFLRRRRWGLPTGSQNRNNDLDANRYRSEESESRTTSSWLSSSFRNRCTPLFCRRRREGRDETARISSTSETSRLHPVFSGHSRHSDSSEEATAECLNRAAPPAPPDFHSFFSRQSREGGPPVESAHYSNRATPILSPVTEMPNIGIAASIADSAQSMRNVGLGVLPGSLLRFTVPPGLGRASVDNVMITVDLFSSGRTPADGQETGKPQSSRDPEKLKQIKESLLLEDSEEDEGDMCRICQVGASTSTNPLIEPCKCAGSLQYVHQECMKKWLQAKINSGSKLDDVTTCELCKEKLHLNLKDFDVREIYRAHHSERADYEFLSSGLYLVVLLHLCEQRFTNLLGASNETSTRDRLLKMILKEKGIAENGRQNDWGKKVELK